VIYQKVKIVRMLTPDEFRGAALSKYVVVEDRSGRQHIVERSWLTADGGKREINAAIDKALRLQVSRSSSKGKSK